MCGISALFAKKLLNASAARQIFSMTQAIRHRGPDDEGYVFFGAGTTVLGGENTPCEAYGKNFPYLPEYKINSIPFHCFAALGHRRLAILDLSAAGHQPMSTPDRRYWITYNGEVYNYLEIRLELEKLGHRFITQSDTEVILHAYAEWGAQCLHHFNGMFAFVIFDRQDRKLFAARDRFGVKPLYIWESPEGYAAFASEIKQFTVLPGWNPAMHGQCVYDYLNWGIKNHTEDSFFQGVKQLGGGKYIETALDSLLLQPKTWYNLKPKPFQGTFEDAAERFGLLLVDAVRLRLRADVAVGSCLSGGLDSSAIVCIANKLLREQNSAEKQMTFTACSDVARFDEKDFADIVVKHTGVKAHYTYPALMNLLQISSDLIWCQDEPFGSTSMYAQWCVFELVKKNGVKVILDGQGSDEQLAGYHGFFGNHFFDLLMGLQWRNLFKEMAIAKGMHTALQPLPLLLNKLTPNALRQPIRKFLGKTSSHADWFCMERLKADRRDPLRQDPNKSVQHQSLQQLMRSSLPMLLHWEDRNSMAHSVESRTPFLDYRLVEFTLGLPGEFKISEGWTKKVMREAMKGILPEEIRLRIDKKGFVTAEEEWVKKKAPQLFLDAVKETMELSQGILKSKVLKEAELMIAGKIPFNFFIWRFVCFGQWIKRFSVSI